MVTVSALDSPERHSAIGWAGLSERRAEAAFDRATRLATRTLGVPVSLLTVVEADRQVFKAEAGLTGPAAQDRETPIDQSFCRYVVASGRPLRVEDARRHSLFADNPAIHTLGIVAYLGVPVRDREGYVLASFCAIAHAPRAWTEDDLANLSDIAAGVESEIALQAHVLTEASQCEIFRAVLDELPVGVAVAELPHGRVGLMNQTAAAILMEDLEADHVGEYVRFGAQHPDGRRYRAEEYPLARSVATGEVIESETMLYRRGDGVVRTLEVSSRRIATCPPLAVVTFADATERLAASEAIAQRDRRLSRFHETTGEGLVEIGPDDRILSLNGRVRAHLQRVGGIRDPEVLIGASIVDVVADEATILTTHLARARRTGEMQRYQRELPEGVHMDIRVVPDRDGSVLLVARDITEEMRLAEGQRLLTQELNHRVKNLFAVVSGMVGMTARVAETPAEMARSLRERIQALSRAHDMIRPALVGGPSAASGEVAVSALASTILSPHLTYESDTMSFEGPAVMLSAAAATNLALVFHEMATNAVKYGALSVPDGALRVTWSIEDQVLVIGWAERGGPAALPPERPGFGSTLIDMVAEGQLRGEVRRRWHGPGLHVEFRLPLALVAARPR